MFLEKNFIFATMKKMVIIFALFLVFKPFVPIVEYWVNYDYIVSELCENKEKPELQCNGKCYLSKEIAKNQTEDSTENKPSFLPDFGIYFFKKNDNFNLFLMQNHQEKACFSVYYNNFYKFLYFSSVFRPPIFF